MARTGISVSFITMGCAKNEVDSAKMANRLSAAGYDIVEDAQRCDVIIVNTCSFIQAATEESIEAILEAAGLDSVAEGKAKLVVSGCMPARYRDDLADELPEVCRFVPCAEEDDIVSIVDELMGIEHMGGPAGITTPSGYVDGAVSSYVKISDGCDRFCSYCAIPYIRGRYHSYSAHEIVSEVAALVERGVREVVLIAQDTGRWGDDLEEPSNLANLLECLASRFGKTWFRVMYIQPEGVTDELVDVVSRFDNICSYFDIPFQHCSPRVLKRMNRCGSGGEYLELLERIRNRIPDATIRTTLIAGFPGETDHEFDELCSFVEEASLDYVGVFPYSREEGTAAYKLGEQVDENEKLYRAQRIRDIADAVSGVNIAARIGSVRDVLVCGVEEDGQLFGRAQCQAPDVDGVTYLSDGQIGTIVSVEITDTLLYEMEGEIRDGQFGRLG